MIKIYFKQAVEMLKQNKFISMIAILGTALAITMIMAIIVSDEIKNISVSPEINRDRTLYIRSQMIRDTIRNGMQSSILKLEILHDYLLPQLKTPELVSAVDYNYFNVSSLVNKQGEDNIQNAIVRKTDVPYWRLYSFSFLEGKPFDQAAFESGMKEAVISATTAGKLFKGEQVLGQMIEIDLVPYRVIGVVADVSPVFKQTYGDIWVSYTSQKKFKENVGYSVMLLARNKKDFPDIMKEVRNAEKKYDSEHERLLTLRGPETHRVFNMDIWGNSNEDLKQSIGIENRKMAVILFILLLVPAINLSGLSYSRIRKRTAEVGVRKAFGAKKHIILIQVLMENLITSLLGGIIGLFLSYWVVFQMRHWLLGIPADSPIPISTLVSFPVFLAVFIICILVNLLSAGFPAYKASKVNIVNSLNQNDK